MDITHFFPSQSNKKKDKPDVTQNEKNNTQFINKLKPYLTKKTGVSITALEYTMIFKFVKNFSMTQLQKVRGILTRLNDSFILDLLHTAVPECELVDKSNDLLTELFATDSFNDDQKLAIDKLFKFLYDNEKKMFGLFGRAGTGKTSKPIEFIVFLLKKGLIKSVVFAAPTNKAVNVMKSKFKSKMAQDPVKINIEFSTIHKLLQYENDFDMSGNKIFVKNKRSIMAKYDLVVIDECSMVSKQVLDDIVEDIKKERKTIKLMFIGDEMQLNPVHEKASPIFDPKFTLIDERSVLIQVMRSNKQAIIDLCNDVRNWAKGERKNSGIGKYRNATGVYLYEKKPNKTATTWFESFLKNNNAIILTWTNRSCKMYNDTARKRMFKKDQLERFEIGDKLILTEFYNFTEIPDPTNNNKFYTSEQIEVLECNIIDKQFGLFSNTYPQNARFIRDSIHIEAKMIETVKYINMHTKKYYKLWQLMIKKTTDLISKEVSTPSMLLVAHELSLEILTKEKIYAQKKLRSLWLHYKRNHKSNHKQIERLVMKPLWKEFNRLFVDPFASVNYGIATTVHVGQGSNYYNVYVDADDILDNSNSEEAMRCIYTALTRTVNELHIIT